MTDYLAKDFPVLAQRLPKTSFARLPTPVAEKSIRIASGQHRISIKYDNLTGDLYGGNKVRKLEYILSRAKKKYATRVATFGTVASNHALATALYASRAGFECTCFLSHQSKTPNVARVLNMHLQNKTEIVRFGGNRATRVATMRDRLIGRNTWVIPLGGSSWLGAVGFVNAGLELADQIAAGEVSMPTRLYVATGTMATAAGLALGLAIRKLPIEIQAIRVTHKSIANAASLQRLIIKTASLLRQLDPAIPADLPSRTHLTFRDDFFGDGYARSNDDTERAIAVAREELGLTLEQTYTGKAMSAMLQDLDASGATGQSSLFWNTYNSRPLPVNDERPVNTEALPDEFLRYFD
jgi:1-aminocyclopropane-1-carboxylate deaminase/D-cysteine desulfhydrase-like pyridoxal-dependent ACC family enzyme